METGASSSSIPASPQPTSTRNSDVNLAVDPILLSSPLYRKYHDQDKAQSHSRSRSTVQSQSTHRRSHSRNTSLDHQNRHIDQIIAYHPGLPFLGIPFQGEVVPDASDTESEGDQITKDGSAADEASRRPSNPDSSHKAESASTSQRKTSENDIQPRSTPPQISVAEQSTGNQAFISQVLNRLDDISPPTQDLTSAGQQSEDATNVSTPHKGQPVINTTSAPSPPDRSNSQPESVEIKIGLGIDGIGRQSPTQTQAKVASSLPPHMSPVKRSPPPIPNSNSWLRSNSSLDVPDESMSHSPSPIRAPPPPPDSTKPRSASVSTGPRSNQSSPRRHTAATKSQPFISPISSTRDISAGWVPVATPVSSSIQASFDGQPSSGASTPFGAPRSSTSSASYVPIASNVQLQPPPTQPHRPARFDSLGRPGKSFKKDLDPKDKIRSVFSKSLAAVKPSRPDDSKSLSPSNGLLRFPSMARFSMIMPAAKERPRSICEAANAGNATALSELLKDSPKGAELQALTPLPGSDLPKTALMFAAIGGHIPCLKILASNGADFCIVDKNGRNVLHHAIEACQVEAVRWVIEEYDRINVTIHGVNIAQVADKDGLTPLHVAAGWGSRDILDQIIDPLISEGVNLDRTDNVARTPLHLAVASLRLAAINTLIDHGANVNVVDSKHETPLIMATKVNAQNAVKSLIEKDVNRFYRDGDGNCAMHHAARLGHLNITDMLFMSLDDLEVKNYRGERPLHLAAAENNERVVRALLRIGCQPNPWTEPPPIKQSKIAGLVSMGLDEARSTNSLASTPLHYACAAGRFEIAAILLMHGGNPNANQEDGRSPLMLACEPLNIELATLLLKNGANVNAATSATNLTALHIACYKGHLPLAKLLIEYGANPLAELKNKNHETPATYGARVHKPGTTTPGRDAIEFVLSRATIRPLTTVPPTPDLQSEFQHLSSSISPTSQSPYGSTPTIQPTEPQIAGSPAYPTEEYQKQYYNMMNGGLSSPSGYTHKYA